MNAYEIIRRRARRRVSEKVSSALRGEIRATGFVHPENVQGKNEYIDWRII